MARATIFLDRRLRYARTLVAGAALGGLAAGSAVPVEPVAAAALWSAPAVLGACPASGAPLVVFPSDNPTHATGPGAIVWDAAGGVCPGGEEAQVAPIGDGDVPGPPAASR